ncbi:MFS transporter [Pseudarthrobacter sp. J1738]|uniref:MFS transporter n=1 Tax=unclassified Pseudarthrobacter TaxID=2647000 RepID=UPI003D28AC9F
MTVISELRMRPASTEGWAWDASVTARLVVSGIVLFVLLVGANLATPLYPLLQAHLGLSSFDVTVAFTSYVLALIGTLLVAGHWSDHIGRRAAMVLAVLVSFAGGLVFAFAGNLLMLSAGRALQGAAVALATGACSAALRELLPLRPEWASRFTLLASSGGVAAGPVIGGLLSLFPHPVSTPFLVQAGILAALLVPLWMIRARPAIKHIEHGYGLEALAPRRPQISREARGAFWMASMVGFLSFTVFGFCLSLAPAYFAPVVHADSRPLVGLLAGLTLGASAVSQLMRAEGKFRVSTGLTVLGVSVAAMAFAAAANAPWLLVFACIAAGAGQGIAFRTVFNTVANKVEPARHAQIISGVYVITYLGSAIPVLGLGWAAGYFGLAASVAVFAGACLVVALVLAAFAFRSELREARAA